METNIETVLARLAEPFKPSELEWRGEPRGVDVRSMKSGDKCKVLVFTYVQARAIQNSWRYLLADLAEEKRRADRLPEQLWRIESDHPEVSQLLQRISDAETVHRQDISDMVMRSDGFALSLA